MNSIHRSRPGVLRLVPLTLVAALALAMASLPAFGQVLDQVSSDALVVVKLHSLDKLNAKEAGLCQQFGLVQMKPEFADPLGALETQLNIKGTGLDKSGDAAFVLLDVVGEDALAYSLIPVTDYKAFLGNFGDAKKDGDLDVVHAKPLNGVETDLFAVNWGTYAAISDNKKALEKKPTGLKLTGAILREWNSKDAVVVANMTVAGPKLLAQLQKHKEEAISGMMDAMTKNPKFDPKYAPLAKVAITQLIGGAEEFLKDCTGAAISLNISDEGISTCYVADFDPASYLGKMVKSTKITDAPLLKGLPDGKYIFYGGGVIDGAACFKVIDDALAPILKEYAKTGDDQKAVTSLLASARKAMTTEKGMALGVLVPTAALGAGALVQEVAVIEGDSKTILGSQKEGVDAMNDIEKLLGAAGMVQTELTYKSDAKTVDGVSFDEFTSKIDPNAKTPEAQQAAQALTMVYGPNGQQLFLGALDEKHVIMGSGVDDTVLSSLIKSGKAQEDVLGKLPEVVDVAKNLPTTRAFVGYFALDTFVTTVTTYMRQVGMAIPLNLPGGLPPIGMAMTTDGSSMRFETYVPTKLISTLVAAGMQTYMQMQGGQPGGPGGL